MDSRKVNCLVICAANGMYARRIKANSYYVTIVPQKLTQDLVDDHYDPDEGVVVMRFNFERIDPNKVYEQRYKDCEDRNPAILTKMREGYRTVESLSKVLQWPILTVQGSNQGYGQ